MASPVDFIRQDLYRQRDTKVVLHYYGFQNLATSRFYVAARGWYKSWRGQSVDDVTLLSVLSRTNTDRDLGFATLTEAVDDYEAKQPFKK